MPIEGPLAITGAAGNIGTVLRRELRDVAPSIRSIDVAPIDDPGPSEQVVPIDVTDLDALERAFVGVEVVVHLAAIATEAPFEDILHANVRGTYHAFEAARRAGVRRVVFASSAHVTGYYPWGEPVAPTDPVRPDTFYGVSKVAGEALGRLYADRHGLEVVALRIVGFAPEPKDAAYVWGWLSERDGAQLLRRAIEAEGITYLCVYGTSRNTRSLWSTEGWDRLGYEPEDDAEAFADDFGELERPFPWQGMRFAERASAEAHDHDQDRIGPGRNLE